ncbi:MAG: GntR family transcriptional regulator [Firmicutes bacterium]|nr:GntR family transcriptional regulator [Bacillota bacterium]
MTNKRSPNKIMDTATPIFMQVMQDILSKIARKDLKCGDKLPSVRDLAIEYNINPNTVQKAVEKLTEQGYLISYGTIGKRITQDNELIEGIKQNLPKNTTMQYIETMRRYGMELSEIPQYIQKIIQEAQNAEYN